MSTAPALRPPAGARALRRVAKPLAGSDPVFAVCCTILALLAALAVAGPWLAPFDPKAVNLSAAYQGIGGEHVLGTDGSGRDLLSRMMVGARSSLFAPLVIALAATAIGTGLGVMAAWARGWPDTMICRTLDVLFALPGLLLAMVAVAVFGRGLGAPIIALAIANIPWVARIVRSAALRERQLPYIAACTIQGLSAFAICRRHLLPNVWRTVLAQGALVFSYAMVDLAAINFLGLGIQPPTPDWGVMVASGQNSIIRGHAEETLLASACIVLAVVSVTMLSHRLGADDSATATKS